MDTRFRLTLVAPCLGCESVDEDIEMEWFFLTMAILFLAGLFYMLYDVMVDPNAEYRSAALESFKGHPSFSRWNATPEQVRKWRTWLSDKRKWSDGLKERKWRAAHNRWCDYFERQIDRAEDDWLRSQRVSEMVKTIR